MTVLTEPQARMLAEIRAAGEKRYNGRARRPIEALAAAGLVEYDFELVPAAIGSWTERFTVRPVRETEREGALPCGRGSLAVGQPADQTGDNNG